MVRRTRKPHFYRYQFLSKNIALCFVLALIFVPFQVFAQNFDSSAFSASKAKAKRQKIKLEFKTEGDEDKAVGGEVLSREKLSVEMIDLRVNSFTELLKIEKDKKKRAEIFLNRATLRLQTANVMRMEKKVAGELTTEEKQTLDLSKSDLNSFLSFKFIAPRERAYAKYLLGLVEIDQKRDDLGFAHFNDALKIDPNSPYASSIVFFLSEYYFENGKPDRSLAVLRKYKKNMTGDEKILVDYKIAWSLISLGQQAHAEEILIGLVKKHYQNDVIKDSVRELAVLSSEVRSEKNLLTLANQLFSKNLPAKMEFLTSAYSNLRRLNTHKEFSIILAELIKTADTPDKRVRLWVDEMNAHDRPHASRVHAAAFSSLAAELESAPPNVLPQLLGQHGPQIEAEVSSLIHSYVSTLSGQAKNHENLSTADMGQQLIRQFEFFEKFFAASKKRPSLFRLWLDVCSLLKNSKCVVKLAKTINDDPGLAELRPIAKVENIIALDAISRSSKSSSRTQLVKSLQDYLKDESAPKWREFSNLLVDTYFEEKKHPEGVTLLESMHARFQDEESFFRLQQGNFEDGKFKAIVAVANDPLVKKSPRLQTIVREASIQLAITSRNENFETFEENILRFIKLSDEPEKKAVAIADYLNVVIAKKEWSRGSDLLSKLDPKVLQILSRKEAFSSWINIQYERGQFSDCLVLLNKIQLNAHPNLQLLKVQLATIVENKMDLVLFKKFSVGAKTKFLKNVLLAKPDVFINAYRISRVKDPVIEKEIILALQLSRGKFVVEADLAVAKLLKGRIPKQWQKPLFPSERIAKAIKIPGKSTPLMEHSKILSTAIAQVRTARAASQNDVKGQTVYIQQRILRRLADTERQLANAIQSSKVHAHTLQAKEFEEHSREIANTINSLMGYAKETSRMPAAAETLLTWPEGNEGRSTKTIFEKFGALAALQYVDRMQSKGNLTEVSYHRLRLCILKNLLPNDVLKKVVGDTLKASELEELKSAWRNS